MMEVLDLYTMMVVEGRNMSNGPLAHCFPLRSD